MKITRLPHPPPASSPLSGPAFVTGSTGLLGNNLVRLLVKQGIPVRALTRSRAKAARQFGQLPGVEFIEGDMTDVPAFAAALSGVKIIFHTAAHFRDAYKGGRHRDKLEQVNVLGTRALLAAARDAGVHRFVHTSSVAVVDGPPDTLINETMVRDPSQADDYYQSKIHADQTVRDFLNEYPDMWACFVLPGWMHGPGDIGPTSAGQLVLDFMHRKLPGIVPGSFSVVDARDVAAVLVAAAEKGRRGERYLAAGRHCTMGELAVQLEHVSGRPAPIPSDGGNAARRNRMVWGARISAKPSDQVSRNSQGHSLISTGFEKSTVRCERAGLRPLDD